MPQCHICKATQARLRTDGLCKTCSNTNRSNQDVTGINDYNSNDDVWKSVETEFGLQEGVIKAIPTPPDDWINKSVGELTAGQMIKLMTQTTISVQRRLNEHDQKLNALQTSQEENATEIHGIKEENKLLNQKLKVSDARMKSLENSNTKMKQIITKQQTFILHQDKNERNKRIIIYGIPEEKHLLHEGEEARSDEEKVKLILNVLNHADIPLKFCRRIGNKDQGPEKRPKILLVEFNSQKDRNVVKNSAIELNKIDSMKYIRIKADLSYEDRNEYKRLYQKRDVLIKENPDKEIMVDKGKLFMDRVVIDEFKSIHSIF